MNSQRFLGKVCLLCIQCRHVGLAIAKIMAQEGGTVILNNCDKTINMEQIAALKKENLKIYGFQYDINKKEDRSQMIEQILNQFQKIDVLVVSASVDTDNNDDQKFDIETISEQMMEQMISTNIKNVFFLIKEVGQHLKPGSNILILSSWEVYFNQVDKNSFQNVTKIALNKIAKHIAWDFRREEIRVNCIAQGYLDISFKDTEIDKNKIDKLKSDLNIPRLGTSLDIAKSAAFMTSDEASYVTGEILVIGGTYPPRL